MNASFSKHGSGLLLSHLMFMLFLIPSGNMIIKDLTPMPRMPRDPYAPLTPMLRSLLPSIGSEEDGGEDEEFFHNLDLSCFSSRFLAFTRLV